jgi:opacity protein-like surface antigen
MFVMGSLSKATVIVILFSAVFLSSNAQQSGYKWMVGVNAGAMIYQGDLTPSSKGSYKTPSFTFGISAGKILNSYFAVRANAVFGKLRGDDAAYDNPAWRKSRSFNFSTPVTEFNAQLLWSPYGNTNHETGQRFTPYLFAGAGVSFVNISRDYSMLDTTVFAFGSKQQNGLTIDSARSLPRTLLVLPAGAGISYALSSRWSLNYELGFRYTFTDYLDGFSQAANPNQKDFYHTQTLGLVYRFGGSGGGGSDKLGCPVMKY